MADGDPIILGHKQDCDTQTTISCTGNGVPAFDEALFVENDGRG